MLTKMWTTDTKHALNTALLAHYMKTLVHLIHYYVQKMAMFFKNFYITYLNALSNYNNKP